jgi:hypothetical protein
MAGVRGAFEDVSVVDDPGAFEGDLRLGTELSR